MSVLRAVLLSEDVLPTSAVTALHRGRRDEAIREVRRELELGTAEAVALVERFLRGRPSLRALMAEPTEPRRLPRRGWLALAAVALLAVYCLVR